MILISPSGPLWWGEVRIAEAERSDRVPGPAGGATAGKRNQDSQHPVGAELCCALAMWPVRGALRRFVVSLPLPRFAYGIGRPRDRAGDYGKPRPGRGVRATVPMRDPRRSQSLYGDHLHVHCTEGPARLLTVMSAQATAVAPFSHVGKRACRRSCGHRASGEACNGVDLFLALFVRAV